MSDHIRVHGLLLTSIIAESPWPTIDPSLKPVLHPIIVFVDIEHSIHAAGSSDDLSHSVDYSAMGKLIQTKCVQNAGPSDAQPPPTAYGLCERMVERCLTNIRQPITQLDIELEIPKAVLRAKGASVKVSRRKDGSLAESHRFCMKELPVHTIVGIHPHEREDKQPVIISLEFARSGDVDSSFSFDFAKLERRISNFVEASAYLTVEALTLEVAQECFRWLDDPELFTVTVRLAKPAALRLADAPEIQITRSLSDFPSLQNESRSRTSKNATGMTLATLSLGANLGDRFQNIELALRHLENFKAFWTSDPPAGELTVVDTSFLYETAPMYVVSQPAFINCACLVETAVSPYDLLRICKRIEETVGRVQSVRFGPRAVDLDIVTYGDQVIDTRLAENRESLDNLEGQLVIPHPRMAEREFVLRPLKDIIPEWVHPHLRLSARSLLSKLLLSKQPTEPPMHKVFPFPFPSESRTLASHNTPATQTYWVLPDPSHPSLNLRTYIMATLNVTPDSFSDGSQHNTLSTALAYVRSAVEAGADIIDIGGYSTRPGAAFVEPSEEIARVVPIIHAIRSLPDDDDDNARVRDVLISVDTFRVAVARAALDAGANVVNDVYAFCGAGYPHASEEARAHFGEMRRLVRERGVPVVMMHSRGDAGSNKDYSAYAPSSSSSGPNANGKGGAVLEGVRAELGEKVLKAIQGKGGVRRWNVVVDPGVGFSKDVEGNLELLRSGTRIVADERVGAGHLTDYHSQYMTPNWNPLAGFPLLIGTSRKSFLSTLLAQPLAPPPPPHSTPSTTSPDSGKVSKDKDDDDDEPERAKSSHHTHTHHPRDFATAAALTCAITHGGAALVRVHAVREMVDVVKVACALRGAPASGGV